MNGNVTPMDTKLLYHVLVKRTISKDSSFGYNQAIVLSDSIR